MVALLRQQLEEEDDALGLHLEGSENENEGEEEEEEKPRQKYIFNFVFFLCLFSFSKLDFYCSATLIGKHNVIRNQKSIRKCKNQAVWRKCKGEVMNAQISENNPFSGAWLPFSPFNSILIV